MAKYNDLTQAERDEIDSIRAQVGLREARRAAAERLVTYFIQVLDGTYRGLQTEDDLEVIKWIHDSMVASARSVPLLLAHQRLVLVRQRLRDIRNMTTENAVAYDPEADFGWPT